VTVLATILESKAREVARLKEQNDVHALREAAEAAAPGRDLVQAIRDCPGVPVIAEIKRRSPSAGTLREVPDPTELARSYVAAGAVGISVLTDSEFFGGNIQDLVAVRRAVDAPLLRKDFIMDPVQLYEAKLAGADAVLLIVAALAQPILQQLADQCRELQMTPVLEIHGEGEIDRALAVNPALIGINNRNLMTLEVSLGPALKLSGLLPSGVLVLAESGIQHPRDITLLRTAGVDAFLVGTCLMRSDDPAEQLRQLIAAEAG
jgi:indole-3-glycerol phosphate synthase